VVHPYLEELSREAQETVDLSMLDGDVIVFIDQVAADNHALRAVSAIGVAFPLHCCAPGKAILAGMAEKDLKLHLDRDLKRETSKTITSARALRNMLKAIRKSGIAYDHEEQSLGISAVGTRIADPFGRQLAISIPVPTIRFAAKEKRLIQALRKYVPAIEQALGQE
jgi:DNA-binding IclR family transcriptional regulator